MAAKTFLVLLNNANLCLFARKWRGRSILSFYFILFYFILFYFILFYFILSYLFIYLFIFYFFIFYFILFFCVCQKKRIQKLNNEEK